MGETSPAFAEPLPVGQLYFPSRKKFRQAFEGIFKRRFFTNHGPLVTKLDQEVAGYLGVRHAVCVTNGTVALMAACKALDLSGSVIVPSFTFPATVQALVWAGLEPIFCDIDYNTHCINYKQVLPLIRNDTSAILGVHVWGRPCDTDSLDRLSGKTGVKIFYDACHAFGVSHKQKKIGNFGELEIFSFHATKILSSAEGGCITTNNDELASRLRTIRNFHSAYTEAVSPLRINGKMTEAQAALALISLDQHQAHVVNNKKQWLRYVQRLDNLPGLRIVKFNDRETQNYQYFVCQINENEFGISRDQLLQVLQAENIQARRYFYPAVHRLEPFASRFRDLMLPETEKLCREVIQLPLGGRCSLSAVDKVSKTICRARYHSAKLKKYFSHKSLLISQ